MKNKTGLLLLILLTIINSSFAQQSDGLAPEATLEVDALGFWKNPNLKYIATEWPTDDADLKFWDVPKLKKAFIETAPTDRNDGLIVGNLGTHGGNKDMIVKLAQEIADGQLDEIDSLLITHKGKLVFESYYSWGRANLTHPQASATKTYTGLALGRAIQLGYLTMADLGKPVVSFLKELDPTNLAEGAEKITLHHALTRRTGIRISKEQREEFGKNPDQIKGQRMVQTILGQSEPITSENLNSFSYGAYSTELVMQVIDAVVPGSAENFIKNELLGKMGITTYRWLLGPSGLPAAGWKSSITSRAMLKLGTLAINKGKWDGEQLIPKVFITKAINRIITTGDYKVYGSGKDISNQGYGYLWWTADMKVGDKSYLSASAQGGGGQFIILIEKLDLVVVFTSHERHPSTLQLAAERILPAFIQNSIPKTISEKSYSHDKFPVLKGPYFGQKPPGLIPEVFAPGIISINGRVENAISFSPDLDEIYFEAIGKNGKHAIYFSKRESNKWTHIEKADFTKGKKDEEVQPFVSHDGKRIYFVAFNSDVFDTGIWYVNRLDHSWGDAIKLDLPINDDKVYGSNQVKNGNLYYFNISKKKNYSAAYSHGSFPEPKGFEVEPGFYHVLASPNEDYLVGHGPNKEDESRNDNNLYVSFKEQDGTWAKPIDLGSAVNSNVNESVPTISPDGKYLFFGRVEEDGAENVYWVSTEIITQLKAAYFKH